MSLLEEDRKRYPEGGMHSFQEYYRKYQDAKFRCSKIVYSLIFSLLKRKRFIEIYKDTKIGAGLYIGHAYGITINPKVILGNNINIHKGVTIGQEKEFLI